MSGHNQTEQATPRRKQKARERGQVARSRELSAALGVLGLTLLLGWLMPGWTSQWQDLFRGLMERSFTSDLALSDPLFVRTFWMAMRWAGPALAAVCVLSVLSLTVQGGPVFASEALAPDWNRLNPASNIKQFFSLGAMSRLLKSLIPVALLLYVAGSILLRDWNSMMNSSGTSVGGTLDRLLRSLYEFCWKAALALLAWSVLDYAVQRAHLARNLRMTKQEVKDEFKETEGNPAIKGRIKRLQRAMRRRRMLLDVPQATVVVTNPNEYAVALRYVPSEMAAPLVLAKGRNALAQRIKRLAYWHEVPVMENPPLARALYKAADVGQTIPASLYTAVAEILAFLFRMQGNRKQPFSGSGLPAADPFP